MGVARPPTRPSALGGCSVFPPPTGEFYVNSAPSAPSTLFICAAPSLSHSPLLPPSPSHSLPLGAAPIPCVVSHQTVLKRLNIYVFGAVGPKRKLFMEKKRGWQASSNTSSRETMALLGLCIPTEGD